MCVTVFRMMPSTLLSSAGSSRGDGGLASRRFHSMYVTASAAAAQVRVPVEVSDIFTQRSAREGAEDDREAASRCKVAVRKIAGGLRDRCKPHMALSSSFRACVLFCSVLCWCADQLQCLFRMPCCVVRPYDDSPAMINAGKASIMRFVSEVFVSENELWNESDEVDLT